MKGNARIIVFVCVVLFILAIVLLNMTLFTIHDITVLNKVESQLIDEQKIISDSDIHIGKNIFVLSEKKSKELIEASHPYIQVIGIERVFPNNVIIHVSVRMPLMAIKVKGADYYAIIDSDLKILQVIDPSNSIYVSCTKVDGLEVEDPRVGVFLDKRDPNNSRLSTISYVAVHEQLKDFAFLNFFESISFTPDNIVKIKLRSGVTICLKDNDEYEKKFRVALNLYRFLGEQDPRRTYGYIFLDNENQQTGESGWNWSENYPYQRETID